MNEKKLSQVAVNENLDIYNELIQRERKLYKKNDIRSPFARDYTRILHSLAYRRLKHKTQVFFNIESDHICTRMEHVCHVESVSYTIAKELGLNDELTKAIACGHDLGHAPFGHSGEEILNQITLKYLGEEFHHELNSLNMVDNVELLPDDENVYKNLSLTYAVRDGITLHCGEDKKTTFAPRKEFVDLSKIKFGEYSPITYEGCVVKIADKIAYIGRDIEDALSLKFIETNDVKELNKKLQMQNKAINTSNLISVLTKDICENSSVDNGIGLSSEGSWMLEEIKKFNLERIYLNSRLASFKKYASLVINELFEVLLNLYEEGDVLDRLEKETGKYKFVVKDFICFIKKYTSSKMQLDSEYQNKKIYGNFTDKKDYVRAIVDFISGMTDRYAVDSFNDLITY